MFVKCDFLFLFCIFTQQAQKADVALLKFPEQLKHIEAAAR